MQLSNKIESRRVDELTDHPLNEVYNSPLSEHERSMLYKSIMENGVQEPLWVTPSGMIVAGHERRRAARDLGLEAVPTRTLENATDAEVLYYLVDNNVSRRGDEKDLMKKAKQAKVLYEHWGIRAGRKKGDDEHATANDVADLLGEAPRTVRRWIKLLELIPEFQLLVSGGDLGLIAGNHLAGLNREFQKQIYGLLSSRGIEKIELNEVKAICKELEYREDRALEEEELGEDDIDPDTSSSSLHAEGGGDDSQPWHTPLEESQPVKAIEAVSTIFPDKGDNLKQRHFLMEIEKAERDVQRFKEKLVPLFDQAVKNESAKEMLTRISENLRSLVDHLQEVI